MSVCQRNFMILESSNKKNGPGILYAIFISLVNTTITQHLKLVESELQTWRTRGYRESTANYMQISNYPEGQHP